MEVDLAGVKDQRAASLAERDRMPAGQAPIEPDGPFSIRNGRDQVIQAGDPHTSGGLRSTWTECRTGLAQTQARATRMKVRTAAPTG